MSAVHSISPSLSRPRTLAALCGRSIRTKQYPVIRRGPSCTACATRIYTRVRPKNPGRLSAANKLNTASEMTTGIIYTRSMTALLMRFAHSLSPLLPRPSSLSRAFAARVYTTQ